MKILCIMKFHENCAIFEMRIVLEVPNVDEHCEQHNHLSLSMNNKSSLLLNSNHPTLFYCAQWAFVASNLAAVDETFLKPPKRDFRLAQLEFWILNSLFTFFITHQSPSSASKRRREQLRRWWIFREKGENFSFSLNILLRNDERQRPSVLSSALMLPILLETRKLFSFVTTVDFFCMLPLVSYSSTCASTSLCR